MHKWRTMKVIKEWTSSFKKNFEERLSNPLFGAFTVSWIIFNWKLVLFLMLSDIKIEEKIKYIEVSYSDLYHILIYPLVSALFITLILPWISFLVQSLQEFVNKKRAIKQYQYDTELLSAKEKLITIQVRLDGIQEKENMELEFKRKKYELDLEMEKQHSEHELAKESKSMEFDFNERSQRYQFEMERDKRDFNLEMEEKKQSHAFEREMEKVGREREYEDRKIKREHELEMRKLDVERYKADRHVRA